MNQAKYMRHLGGLAKDMEKWSRGKFAYDTVRVFPQAVMPTDSTKRTSEAMLVKIEESDTYGSCSELPEFSYKITKYRNSINSIRKMGVTNPNVDF